MFLREIRPVNVGAEALVVKPKTFEKFVCVFEAIEYAAFPVTVWFPWFTLLYVNVGLLRVTDKPEGKLPETPVTVGDELRKVAEAVEFVPS